MKVRGEAFTVQEVIGLLADEAEKRGASAGDTDGKLRRLVTENGLGFNAWFCVACELSDRASRASGRSGHESLWKRYLSTIAMGPGLRHT